jgi:hypothetical protein
MIKAHVNKFKDLKLWLCLEVMMEKPLLGDIIFAHFSCKQKIILDGSNIEETIQKAIAEILKHIEEYVYMGSGWVISQLMHLDCQLAKYRPLK